MLEEKINNIETNLAHHEQKLRELDEVVSRQYDEIDRLKKHISHLQKKIVSIEELSSSNRNGISAIDHVPVDKPPHY